MERYLAIYEAAAAKGARLVNSPEQYQTGLSQISPLELWGKIIQAVR